MLEALAAIFYQLEVLRVRRSFLPEALQGENQDVYGIEERYREKLLNGDGKAWLVEIRDEWRWHDKLAGAEGRTPDEYLRAVKRHAERSPYANENFLKNGFLQACKNAGVFETIVKPEAALPIP